MDDYEGMSHFEKAASIMASIAHEPAPSDYVDELNISIQIAQTHALLSLHVILHGIYMELVNQNHIARTVSGLK